jgi:hypothetical protein
LEPGVQAMVQDAGLKSLAALTSGALCDEGPYSGQESYFK